PRTTDRHSFPTRRSSDLSPQQSSPQLSSEQIAQIVASPDRSEADRTNDLRRKPEQMLAFIGIRPGIVALDLSAAGGYTTELLARSEEHTSELQSRGQLVC